MPVLYTNNAEGKLSASITNTQTSLSVQSGQGALFPSPSGGDYFFATLIDAAKNYEIVQVTARSGDTFTIVRAQDGTTGRAFSSGDKVELRLVRALLDALKTDAAASVNLSGYLPLSGGTLTGTVGIGVTPSAMESASGVQVGNTDVANYVYGKRGMSTNAYFDGTNWKYTYTGPAGLYQPSQNQHSWYIAASGSAGANITWGTAAMRLDSTGLSASAFKLATWAVSESGGVLYFSVNGVNKAKLDSSGNLTVTGNVTGYGTV